MTPPNASAPGGPTRVVLVFPAQSYRTEAYVAAARRLGIELVLATDLPSAFAKHGMPVAAASFREPESSAMALGAALGEEPPAGIVATNETSAVFAAHLARRLSLPFAAVEGVVAARDKRRMRELLRDRAGMGPGFRVVEPGESADQAAAGVRFPCVVKPPMLTGSQGVIRANDPGELARAVRRVRAILARHPDREGGEADFHRLLVEDYLPGKEVAIEALMTAGRLVPLAIFDKPDELSGPFFEETLYVTPSRLPELVQARIVETTERAARSLGLLHGPIHAELRTAGGEAALVEIAARSMGGLCSRVFEHVLGPLEDLILSHAAGLPLARDESGRAPAAGVMMLPIPRSGVLRTVRGLDEARRVPGISGVTLALRPGEAIRALPEGASYLGFSFARGDTPEEVEAALRAAHGCLEIDLAPLLDVAP